MTEKRCAENAETIRSWRNDDSKLNPITPQKLIAQSNVKRSFTTNDVFDGLSVFGEMAKKGYNFKVIPAFRADKIMNVETPSCEKLLET